MSMKSDKQLPEELMQTIKHLDDDQLHLLHRIVVERLNFIHRARALAAMREFNFLDRVWFTYNGQRYEGTVARINQKTISVNLDDGEKWNVGPSVLHKLPRNNYLR